MESYLNLELDAVESYCGTWSSYLRLIWRDLTWFELPHHTLHPSVVETLPNEFYKLEGDKKAILDRISKFALN